MPYSPPSLFPRCCCSYRPRPVSPFITVSFRFVLDSLHRLDTRLNCRQRIHQGQAFDDAGAFGLQSGQKKGCQSMPLIGNQANRIRALENEVPKPSGDFRACTEPPPKDVHQLRA